jgi:Lon protease-like protein
MGTMGKLPLFPLNTVLFPGTPISLHIFESRYKRMIEDCVRERDPFGVVLIREGVEALGPLADPHTVGCTAQIVQIRKLEEGRMKITAIGRERFRILTVQRDQPYLVGQVKRFPLEQSDPRHVSAAATRLRPWVVQYLRTLADAANVDLDPAELPRDPLSLVYQAAYILQIPLEQKQALLSYAKADRLLAETHRRYKRELALLRVMLGERSVQDDKSFSMN